jgi:hypothetical protein
VRPAGHQREASQQRRRPPAQNSDDISSRAGQASLAGGGLGADGFAWRMHLQLGQRRR